MGEPPVLVDPRRWGGLIGLVGGMVFVASYSPALGTAASVTAWGVGLVLVAAALWGHYVRPVALGPLARPSPLALAAYGGCVLGELALIAAGSQALASVGRGDLRPSLIAAVVGLHFLPFARVFREAVFLYLGAAVAVLGAVGLLAGALGVPRAGDALAVVAGLVMIAVIALYARGRFTSPPSGRSA